MFVVPHPLDSPDRMNLINVLLIATDRKISQKDQNGRCATYRVMSDAYGGLCLRYGYTILGNYSQRFLNSRFGFITYRKVSSSQIRSGGSLTTVWAMPAVLASLHNLLWLTSRKFMTTFANKLKRYSNPI